MARKPEIAELNTRLLMQTLGSDRRYKRIVIIGGIAVVVIAVGAVLGVREMNARETAGRESAVGSLSSCLFGADGLKADESPGARFSIIKLGVVGIPPEKRAKAGELAWPASCSTEAFKLQEATSGTPVSVAAEALGKALRADPAATGDERAEVEKLWTEIKTAKINIGPAPGAPVAPKPATPVYSAEQFRGLPKFLSGSFSLANVWVEPTPGKKLHFIVDEKTMPEGPVACTVSPTDSVVKCIKLPEAVAAFSPGVRLIGSTDDAARPFFFAGDRGALGIFPPDGKKAVGQGTAYGASAHADGSIAYLYRKDGGKDLHLDIQPAGTGLPIDQTVLQPSEFDAFTQAGFFWDWLVWRAQPGPGAAKGSPNHLSARHLEAAVLKPTVDVGELEDAPLDKAERDREQITSCKSDDGLAVRVRGLKGDQVAFFAGGRWTAPMKATTRGGAFTCHGLEAIATTVDHVADRDKDAPTITQAKCNTSGCATVKIDGRSLFAGLDIAPTDAGASVAADVGGKLLFLWNSGSVGGLRMRIAPADHLKETEDVIIAETREEKSGAAVSSVAGMRVVPTNDYALLFLTTTTGVKLLRVDPAGKLTPLTAAL